MRWIAMPARGTAPLLLAAALAGCQAMGGDAQPGVAAGVGENLVGETCRVASAPSDQAAEAGARAAYDVYCGTWEQPSARIVRLPAGGSVAQQLTAGPWRERLNALVVCQPPVAADSVAGAPALTADCKLQHGGWPYQLLAVRIDDDTYLADSIPAAIPALHRAIAVISGRSEPAVIGQSSQQSEAQRLEAKLTTLYQAAEIRFQYSRLGF